MNYTLSTIETSYTTLPMSAVSPSTILRDDEEEVYMAFESALSGRSRVFTRSYTPYFSEANLAIFPIERQTGPVDHSAFATRLMPLQKCSHRFVRWSKRQLVLLCFGIMCLCAGFDFMGVLVLHMR